MRRVSSNPNRRLRPEGFTLVELLVVLVLIGVASAIVIPFAARSYGNLKLHLAADSMRTMFHDARSRSRFEGRVHAVIFMPPDRRGRELLLVREDGHELEKLTLPAEVMVAVQRADGSETNSVDPVHFFPNGACEAKQFDLSDPRGKHLLVDLTAITGEVHEAQIGSGLR